MSPRLPPGMLAAGLWLTWTLSPSADWYAEAATPHEQTAKASETIAGSRLQQVSSLLVRDPIVQKELRLRPSQVEQVEILLEKADQILWGLRDVSLKQGNAKADAAIERFDRELAAVLDAWQVGRLKQIVLQTGGMASLLRPEITEAIRLSTEQRQKIIRITTETQEAWNGLDAIVQKGAAPDKVERIARELHGQEQRNVLAILSENQRRELAGRLGSPFDTSRLMGNAFRAPELKAADAWINSGPLTLAGLRGKVVILNFYAFGCVNCIHNYPSYKRWHEMYSGKDVIILGIHTPETQSERDIDAVRRKAVENGLTWPILVDNSQANWHAWSNRVWPSVYLIDKRGNIRSWWYGELNWQQTRGEDIMRRHIDRLLAEPSPASQPATSQAAAD